MRQRLISALLRLFSLLPLSVLRVLGALLGSVVWYFGSRERKISEINIGFCFPDNDSTWRHNLTRQSLIHTGKALLESSAMWCWPQDKLCRQVTRVHNEHLLSDAINAGKGVILVSPHIGAWELTAIYVGARHPMVSMYRPPRCSSLDPILRNARERFGNPAAPIDSGGLRLILRSLKQGKLVGILPDQEPEPGYGVFAPFFGVPAYTMTLLGNLATKTGACVVYSAMLRVPEGFELHFVMRQDNFNQLHEAAAATAINQGMQQCILLAPEQYLWSYRRFRQKPDGKKRNYQAGTQ